MNSIPSAVLRYTHKLTRRHTFRTGAVYDGEWLGNERCGFGVQTWPDGAEYRGEWRQNTATGKGCFRHCDGDDVSCGLHSAAALGWTVEAGPPDVESYLDRKT